MWLLPIRGPVIRLRPAGSLASRHEGVPGWSRVRRLVGAYGGLVPGLILIRRLACVRGRFDLSRLTPIQRLVGIHRWVVLRWLTYFLSRKGILLLFIPLVILSFAAITHLGRLRTLTCSRVHKFATTKACTRWASGDCFQRTSAAALTTWAGGHPELMSIQTRYSMNDKIKSELGSTIALISG